MSHSKISQLSTKSVSKQGPNMKNSLKREFYISSEYAGGKSDISIEFNCSFNNQDSSSIKELGKKELNLLAELDALDVSIIPNESRSISLIKSSNLDEEKKDNFEEFTAKPKPLLLETSQIRHKWWCNGCILSEEKHKANCFIM